MTPNFYLDFILVEPKIQPTNLKFQLTVDAEISVLILIFFQSRFQKSQFVCNQMTPNFLIYFNLTPFHDLILLKTYSKPNFSTDGQR